MTTPTTDEPTCFDCAFYRPNSELGTCHRYAPAPMVLTLSEFSERVYRENRKREELEVWWPAVEGDGWCGEWVGADDEQKAERDRMLAYYASFESEA